MNREEAKQALKDGERLTHTYFSDDEWVQSGIGRYEFEDGCQCSYQEFWSYRNDKGFDEGWSIIKGEDNVTKKQNT